MGAGINHSNASSSDPDNDGVSELAIEGINEINITPFVDVVLVLLVIFMVTAPAMIKEGLKVQLPKSLSSDLPSKVLSKGIAITSEGQILIEGQLVSEDDLDQKLEALTPLEERSQVQFLISADADSRHSQLVKVIDHLKRNSYNSFALQVEKIVGPQL